MYAVRTYTKKRDAFTDMLNIKTVVISYPEQNGKA